MDNKFTSIKNKFDKKGVNSNWSFKGLGHQVGMSKEPDSAASESQPAQAVLPSPSEPVPSPVEPAPVPEEIPPSTQEASSASANAIQESANRAQKKPFRGMRLTKWSK